MTDDLVKRYQLDYHHTRTYAEMAEDCDGDWVKYKDYKDAAVRIEELENTLSLRTNLHGEATYLIRKLETKLAAKEKLMLALAGDKIDLVSELAGVKGKLAKEEAKVVELEEYKWMYEDLCK